MYANLAVSIAPHGSNQYETIYAHEVKVVGTRVVIGLDANDGSSSHAEPAGEREIDLMSHHFSVCADF